MVNGLTDDEMTQIKLVLQMIKSKQYNEDQIDSIRKLHEDTNNPENLSEYTEEEEMVFFREFSEIPLILEALVFLHAEFYKHKNNQETMKLVLQK